MSTIPLSEAKARLSEIADEVECLAQRRSHAVGVLGQGSTEELHACRGDGLRQLPSELACRSTGHLYPVGQSGWVQAR
jgi:hypothetical protein